MGVFVWTCNWEFPRGSLEECVDTLAVLWSLMHLINCAIFSEFLYQEDRLHIIACSLFIQKKTFYPFQYSVNKDNKEEK